MTTHLSIRNSIATTLLKVIFGLYLIVTIIITTIQMSSEFQHTEKIILNEIKELSKSFSPSIAAALWTYNTDGLNSILVGMQVNAIVVGVKVYDSSETYSIGNVANTQEKSIALDHDSPTEKNHFFKDFISHKFPIIFSDTQGKEKVLGNAIIYSSNAVVFERVKYGFFLIILGAIIKTLILWFLFIYFIRRIIGKPLNKLTEQTNQINLENLSSIDIGIKSNKQNELKLLENAYNQMLNKLKQEREKLDILNKSLEKQVHERTQDLKNEVNNRKNAQLEAENANNAKTMFLNNMSHELRTPLNGIMGNTFLLGETNLNQEQQENISAIKNSAEDLLKLIDDIFDFSNVESGTLKLNKKPFDIKACTKQIIHTYYPLANKQNINLNFHLSDDVPDTYTGDQKRIQQVLDNLLDNALKFTATGTIEINLACFEKDLIFSVKDSGIGIAENKLATIFESFTQVDPSTTRQFDGTGIGLTICKHLIALMKGQIWVESMPNYGSTFYFTLPSNNQERKHHSTVKESKKEKVIDTQSKNIKRILMIENDSKYRIIARKHITELGYSIDMAASSEQAIHTLKKNNYQLVFISKNIFKTEYQKIYQYVESHCATRNQPKIIVLNENELNQDNHHLDEKSELLQAIDKHLSVH